MSNNIARRITISFAAAILAGALAFFLPADLTFAESSQDIDLSINAGFEGKCKMGSISPVSVEVGAHANGADGVLEVEAGGVLYAYPLQIPENSRKKVNFFVPVYRPDVQISAHFKKNGHTVAQAVINPAVLPENSVFIGVLSDEPQKYKYLSSADFSSIGVSKAFAAALVEETDLSDEALGSFNIIIIDNFDPSRLGEEMRNALKRWVSKGNLIVIGAKKYAYKNLKGLFDYTGASTAAWGNGAVIFAREDLEEGDPQYVAALVQKDLTTPIINRMWGKSSIAQKLNAAESLYSSADESLRPSQQMFFLVLLLVVSYIAAGFFSIFMSKKYKWLFSAVVAGFCTLFYLAALGTGLQESSAASTIIDILGSGNVRQTYALTGVYPARGKTCNIGIDTGELLCLPDASCIYLPGKNSIVFSTDGPHYVFSTSTIRTDLKEFEMKLTGQEILTGIIKNPYPYRLRKCFMVMGDTFINLGDIDGREEVEVKYRLDYGLRGTGDFNFLTRIEKLAGLDDSEKTLLEYYYSGLEDGAFGGRVFGFGQEQMNTIVDGRKRRLKSQALHVFNVNIAQDGERMVLPWGYIKPAALAGGEAWSLGQREFVPKSAGQILLFYPFPANFEAEEVDFYIASPEIKKIEIYNWNNSSWESFDGGLLSGESLERYTSEGPLLMKIQSDSGVVFPEIYAKGAYRKS